MGNRKFLNYIFVGVIIVLCSCCEPTSEPLEFLIPPDTNYTCKLYVLDANSDTLNRVEFHVLDGDPGLHRLDYSTVPGSIENRLSPFMYRQRDESNNFSIGKWDFIWQLKNFTLDQMGMNASIGDLDFDAKHVYQYIVENATNINKSPHNVDLNISFQDTMGIEFSNNHGSNGGLPFPDADERLNVELITVDTIEIHTGSNTEYHTEVEIEALFDGYLFTEDNQDSIFINGCYRIPIAGLQWQKYDE